MDEFFRLLSDIELREPLLEEACRKVLEGQKILDIATGSGFFIRNLLQKDVAIVCVDFNPSVLLKLKKELDSIEKRARVYYVCCDATRLPMGDGNVDITTSWSAIAHIPDFRKMMGELKRVTNTKIILVEPTGEYYIRAFRDFRCQHELPGKEKILPELAGFRSKIKEKKGFLLIEASRIKHSER